MGLIRLLLALSVVVGHVNVRSPLVSSRLAVQIFYMISGFLISYILVEAKSYSSVRRFYLSRGLRIFPAYYAVAVVTLLGYVIIDHGAAFASLGQEHLPVKIFLAFANLTIFGQDWTLFFHLQGHRILFGPTLQSSGLWNYLVVRQAWTLGVEFSFYALAPFIVTSRRLLVAVFVASVLSRVAAILAGFGNVDPWTYRFFPFELAIFSAGALSHQILLPRARKFASAMPPLCGAIVAAFIAELAILSALRIEGIFGSIVVLMSAALMMPFGFIFQSRSEFDRRIGDLSYPVYIGHAFTIWGLGHVMLHPTAWWATVASLAFAQVLVLFVIAPMESLRTRIRATPTTRRGLVRPALALARTDEGLTTDPSQLPDQPAVRG